MKITMGQALDAYLALRRMQAEKIRFSTEDSLRLVRLKKLLHLEAGAFAEAEQALIEKYAEKDEAGAPVMQGPGQFVIAAGQAADYTRELKEIRATEIKLAHQPFDIAAAGISLDMEIVEALDGLVNFGG